jgi:hypothetical protein
MTKPARTVWDLPRNDIDAVREFWLENEIGPDEWRVLLRLQDDPQKLIDAAKAWSRVARDAKKRRARKRKR